MEAKGKVLHGSTLSLFDILKTENLNKIPHLDCMLHRLKECIALQYVIPKIGQLVQTSRHQLQGCEYINLSETNYIYNKIYPHSILN
jgi:hypothetical protein